MTQELEHADAQPEPESPTSPPSSPQPAWLRLGLGLIAIALILTMLWPEDLRSRILGELGFGDMSIARLEQAAVDDPTNEALQYELASAYYLAGRFDDAWSQFRSVEAYRLAAEARPEIVEAEKVVQDEPASKEAHFKLGTAWARAQLLAPAEIAFKQAVALDDQYVDAHTNLGVVYYQMGRLPEALSEYDAALAVSPDDADIHHNKGAVLVQQALQASPPDEGLLNQGVSEFERALEIDPDLPQAHFSLGVIHMMRGQKEQAITEFQRFLALDDGSDPQATQMAQDYLAQLEK